jgi:serine/threonine protein kinase
MEIKLINKNGVPAPEITAHKKIFEAFNESVFTKNWTAYASFKLTRSFRGSGDDDFDLVLITHSNAIVIELKNWHGKKLESMNGHWYLDGEDQGGSPVELVNLKAKKLASLMRKKLGDDKTPFVLSFVVIQDGIEELNLTEDENLSVLYLYELLEWVNEKKYAEVFNRRPRFNPLSHLKSYDVFFGGNDFRPKDYLVHGFRPGPAAIWEHPSGLYSEFRAVAKDNPDQIALLRQWNFGVMGMSLIGEGSRAFIGLREQKIFEYVASQNEELSIHLLRPIVRNNANDVTFDFAELYSLPSKLSRLTEFKNSVLPKLTPDERILFAKALLSRFADLHDLRVAHRDVGEHCLWLERPARVVMTGFPAAYYPSLQTVTGFSHEIKVEGSLLPEDSEFVEESTPFRRDVFLLGVASYQILYGEKPPKVKKTYQWSKRADDPYEGILDEVLKRALSTNPNDRFDNARELLEALNSVTTLDKHTVIDVARFEPFRANTKLRDYDETDVFLDEDDQIFFRSTDATGDYSVKCWHGIEPDPLKQDLSLKLLAFLERARTLRGCAIPGVPKILDFGLGRKSLLLVMEWVDGETINDWLQRDPSLGDRLEVAAGLLDTLDRIHSFELSHGDVHPQNIVITQALVPTFIDFLDFQRSTTDAYTTSYLPLEYKKMSPIERDRYGIAAVIAEIFGGSKTAVSGPYPIPVVYERLFQLLDDKNASTLEPLQRAITEAARTGPPEELPVFKVILRGVARHGFIAGVMHPDNGGYHVSVEYSRKNPKDLHFRITGVGSQLRFDWSIEQQICDFAWVTPISQVQLMRSQTMRAETLNARIEVLDGSATELSDLAEVLVELETVKRLISKPVQIQAVKKIQLVIQDVEEPILVGEEKRNELPVPLAELWKTLLEAEEEALCSVSVSGEKRQNQSRRNQYLVPYHIDSGMIDFDQSDFIVVESLGNDKKWRKCGSLNLRETTFGELGELAIDDLVSRVSLKIGEKLRFRSTLEKASFTRRSMAVERILADKAVIPNLISYFEPNNPSCLSPVQYPDPSDESLSEYARGDKQLNETQRQAFIKVIGNGPISLLQGPPGTGKTWFIASLMHYLMTVEHTRKILLVSQAHEAVNNALEKCLELCREKGIAFDAVRLGQESSASDGIRHLHSSAIEQSYKEKFKAEKKERIVLLACEMGLPKIFVQEFFDLRHQLGEIVRRINMLEEERAKSPENNEMGHLTGRIRSLTDSFEDRCRELYDVTAVGSPNEVLEILEKQIIQRHDINSPDVIRRLRQLLKLSDDWLSALGSPNANFAEFLAKSRTVVAGTLVGIGHRASGVVQNLYDWVIIDEAGRAAPSELAVAMQMGHRILLVGDHKQLPPNFSQEVQDIIKEKYQANSESSVFSSDFERVFDNSYGREVGSALRLQYRMAPEIGDLVSKCFYEGKLNTGRQIPPDYYTLLPSNLEQQVNWIDMSVLGDQGRESSSDNGAEKWNEAEARVVMSLLRKIIESDEFIDSVKKDLQPGEPAIGVICMYGKQRAILDRLKAEASWLGDSRRLVKIDTVDSYQGKENRIVILSTVRNNPFMNAGFLRSSNRVNVALSRAMDKLFIVAPKNMWIGRNAELPLGKVLKEVELLAKNQRASILSAKDLM